MCITTRVDLCEILFTIEPTRHTEEMLLLNPLDSERVGQSLLCQRVLMLIVLFPITVIIKYKHIIFSSKIPALIKIQQRKNAISKSVIL